MYFVVNVCKMDIIDQVMYFIWVITVIVKFIIGEEVEYQFKVIRYLVMYWNKIVKVVMFNFVVVKFYYYVVWFFYGKDIFFWQNFWFFNICQCYYCWQ